MSAVRPGARADLDPARFLALLEQEQIRLQDEIRALRAQDSVGGSVASPGRRELDEHPGDQPTDLFLREQDAALEESIRGELHEIEQAVHRVNDGTFGYCARCGKPIPVERLEYRPFAVCCVPCAS